MECITAGKRDGGDASVVMDHSTEFLPFRSILHLSDFSACSDKALGWAVAAARAHHAGLSLLHVVVPDALTYMTPDSPAAALDMQEEWALGEMRQRAARLADLPHRALVLRGNDVWSAVSPKLAELKCDLLVLGTHGRTGLGKLLLGSIAENVLRHSTIPVVTVGAEASPCGELPGKFHCILLATDFAPGSAETAGYAAALAEADQAHLLLLHVCKANPRGKANGSGGLSVAEALHRLHELAPQQNHSSRKPEPIVEFGDAGTTILEIAKRKSADLIVMGLRDALSVFAATHLDVGTTHAVVAHAPCPVLTIRPLIQRAMQPLDERR